MLAGIADTEGQGIKYWSWIYIRADCFYGQYNIYWYAKIKLSLRFVVGKQRLPLESSGGVFPRTPPHTHLCSHLVFTPRWELLEVQRVFDEPMGFKEKVSVTLKLSHFPGCVVQAFFIFKQFVSRQNLSFSSVPTSLHSQRPISQVL